MASIWKHPNSPYYTACWQRRLEDGSIRKVKRSTKCTNATKALGIAMDFERLEQRTNRENLTQAGVENVVTDIVERATGKKSKHYSIREWYGQWLQLKEARSPATHARYKSTVDGFLAFLGSRADARLTLLSIDDVVDFRDAERTSGKAIGTVNTAVKHLRIALNLAKKQGLVSTNVAEAVQSLSDREDFEKDVFSAEMVRNLMDATRRLAANPKARKAAASYGEWRGVILLGYFTGLRLRDVTGLRWESVDLADQRISVRTSKTGERVILPIHEQLLEYLLALPTPANASDPLFAELSQRKTSGNGGLSMAFARIMKEAGICGRRSEAKGDKGRARNSLSFHALRHSFNSNLMNAGVDQETRQKLTGHRSKAMNDKYTHVELETLRGAISKLTSI